MGRLTTHVLDTAHGRPAGGVGISLYCREGQSMLLTMATTNADGRTDQPLLHGHTFMYGVYELVFAVGQYFRAQGLWLPEPAFLEEVVVRFGISDTQSDYHVPLLVSPWSYSTYRGS